MKRDSLALRASLTIAIASLAPATLAGNGPSRVGLTNWQAPATWTPQMVVLTDQTGPMPFVPIAPCRIADTRTGFGFTGAYGPPAIGAGTSRTFDITGSGCAGIPSTAAAFSFNLTVTNTSGPGFIQAYPAGGSAGGSSAVNYTGAGQTVANAAVTTAGTGANAGKITITAGVSTTDVIIDINGYYAGAPSSGKGMSLTSTGANDTLTLIESGSGGALRIFSNTTGFPLKVNNTSTSCTGSCGGYFWVDSTSSGAPDALSATAAGTAIQNYGIRGYAKGTGTASSYLTSAAGVYGEASNATYTFAHGVVGVTFSTNVFGAGVLGEATAPGANGGVFQNSGGAASLRTYISYNDAGGVGIGLDTNGVIKGTLGLAISGGTKNFVTPHPEDPSKQIEYVAAEGPTSDVFFRGTARLQDGVATIPVPDHFRLVARQDSYMTTLTPIGERTVLAVESEGPEGIVVRGSGTARFHYVVWGERDEFRNHEAVRPNTSFTPESLERSGALATYPASTKAILVKNGTIHEDGTYNRATATRMNWTVPEPQAKVSPAEEANRTGGK